MVRKHSPLLWWLLAWAVLSLAGSLLLARLALERHHAAFETEARIVHRLLSQRVVAHDAVLATLALLQPGGDDAMARLPSVYPQILSVSRSIAATPWADAALREAQAISRTAKGPVLADMDIAQGRYRMVLAAEPAAYALQVDIRSMVPWSEWPMAPADSPVAIALELGGQRLALQPGRIAERGWSYDFHKTLAAASQPFDVVARRTVRWAELPWGQMLAWSAMLAAALAVARWLQQQAAARRRAEALLRLGQVGRLNALGELAAGMAHELNQPLTALLANTQAARRLIAEEPPELDTARNAMGQAVEQARRASEVVGRLRRAVERPELGAAVQPVDLHAAVLKALDLLEPELRRRGVALQVDGMAGLRVLADPVALEQIVHNLLLNALQALEQTPAAGRSLALSLAREPAQGVLAVQDSGPGLPAEVLPHVFEPFFSTRAGGLGLGLSLCESLASGMGGSLSAANAALRGAVFRLRLPLAEGAAA
ncbi:ATP-binding protein [Pseudorhodoferax sp. Leaf267]|uniref:sensor histidine kinase n=1 Tax=Pseudorhodoferax sp. Leaf267 TaxID=1736316 RepID=UPI0006FE9A3C|nr:ATP-binding protein [Pseudorhodoferax sp. Leaf267]KQP13826.1 histidine kinase [Pseudorhodoferax sp. Leaf267]